MFKFYLNKPSLWELAVYFFFIAMIVYKTIIKITVMYSIGITPLKGQDLTAYRLWSALSDRIISY
ncbi:MAG: hypothetical protein SO152_04375 [Ruminococcus sp.]|nr:hypothetical protein [Ruminococcus sp.]